MQDEQLPQQLGGRETIRTNRPVTTARTATLPTSTHPLVASIARFAKDENTSLIRFSFALTVASISSLGLLAMGWGATLENAWLASAGFLLLLVGSTLYGISVHDGKL